MIPKIVLGIPAQTGAGKDTVGGILQEKGYVQISLSDELRAYARKNGINTDKESLQNLGDNLRLKHGADILARWVSVRDEFASSEKIVITAIRHPAEMKFLKENFGAKFIGLAASQWTRFEFSRERKRPGDPESFAEFKWLDDREQKSLFGERHRMNLSECLKLCQIVITNEKLGNSKEESLGHLKDNVYLAMKKIGLEDSIVNKERE